MATPKQIKQQSAAADETHAKLYPVEKPADPEAAPPKDAAAAATESTPPPANAAPQIAPPPEVELAAPPTEVEPDPGTPAWEQKYRTLQGKYDAEMPRVQEENSDLRGQIGDLQSILANFQQGGAVEVQPGTALLREDEVEEYGADLIDVVKRAAREELNPELTRLTAENEQLRNNLGAVGAAAQQSAGDNLYSSLDAAVPGWREVNKSQPFLDWLGIRDVYSGYSRQQMLTTAFEAKDAARVVAFFKGYKQEQTVTAPKTEAGNVVDPLDTLVAPGQPSATGAAGAKPQGLIWTQADIARFYKAVNTGKFKGREKEKLAYEHDIIAAGQQGRVIG